MGGFALFSTQAEARMAAAKLRGAKVNGSKIQVDSYTKKPGGFGGKGGGKSASGSFVWKKVWQPKFQKGWNGKGGGKGKSGPEFKVQHTDRTVWIGGVEPGSNHKELKALMEGAGNCKRVQVGKKGSAFAFFATAEEAQNAIASLNGAEFNGSTLEVDSYNKK